MASKLGIYREVSALLGAEDLSALTDDVEVRYVIDRAYDSAVQHVLGLGWWRFAFATTSPSLSATSAAPGYTYKFSKPADWLRTHSVVYKGTRETYPVDWHEMSATEIAVKFSTALAINYIQNDATTESAWPEVFAKALAAYIAFEVAERVTQNRAAKSDLASIFQDRLGTARQSESLPPPLVLPEHAYERAARMLLESGTWRWATKTSSLASTSGTPSNGYDYRFTKPADWVRTLWVYKPGAETQDIDYRDEGGYFHADYDPIVVRYISTDGLTPTSWSEKFRAAWWAHLEAEAAAQPGSGASANEQAALYAKAQALLKEARNQDAKNERPVIKRDGLFNTARRGFWRNLEQG